MRRGTMRLLFFSPLLDEVSITESEEVANCSASTISPRRGLVPSEHSSPVAGPRYFRCANCGTAAGGIAGFASWDTDRERLPVQDLDG
jgi:hypothetical protein